MSRRPNKNRRVTSAKLEAATGEALRDYDAALSQNITRILNAYHAKHVAPLQEWAALPWWRRVFVGRPKP